MHIFLKSAALVLLFTATAKAQAVRSGDAHVHGSGTASIAVEGSTLTLLVETPAYDVLGFEHVATAAEDKRLVAAVRSLLENPGSLFELSPNAGCSLQSTDVSIGPEGAGDAHDHGHSSDGEAHSDIVATYSYSCAAASSLNGVGFLWFEAFPLSQKLDVVVLDASGQHAGSVTPGQPLFRVPQS